MLRVFASMALMFLAVGWSAVGVIVIFLFAPYVWSSIFGPSWAPVGALAAMAGMIWLSARMMRLADRLLNEPEHRPRELAAAPAEVTTDVPSDWQDYTAEIVRNKRWAFYRRTRQFDRLAKLEAERPR